MCSGETVTRYAPILIGLSSPDDGSDCESARKKDFPCDGSLLLKLMAFAVVVALLLLIVSSICRAGDLFMLPRDRVKAVEDYVVSAKFDDRKDLPQLIDHKPGVMITDNAFHRKIDALEERDFLVHHHHLPPPVPPVPPIPPPPVGLALPSSVFAVGFITFLILLNTLYTSFLLSAKHKHSLLGSLAKPLGRRKRSLRDHFDWPKRKFLRFDSSCL